MPLVKAKIDANQLDEVESNEQKTESKSSRMNKVIEIQDFLNQHYNFRYNVISERIEFKAISATRWIPFSDRSRNNILIELKLFGIARPSEDLDTIIMSDFTPEYNAPKKYFEELEPVDNGMLKLFFDTITIDNQYEIEYETMYLLFKKYMIASYYCMIGERKNDVMLMLLGKQGTYKTSWLNNICPVPLKDYLKTGHIDLYNKEYKNNMCDKVFYNIDDQMEIIMGKEFNSLKAIISSDIETNRKAYARFESTRKRIVNFMGSVNNPKFLRDVENRRYLCIPITKINDDYRNLDIDQVWQNVLFEATDFKNKYIFDFDDRVKINGINQKFVALSEEEEMFDVLFKPATEADEIDCCYMNMTEILIVLNQYSNLKLRQHNLNLVMQRKNIIRVSKRLERMNKQSYYFYKLIIATNDTYALNLLKKYRDEKEPEKEAIKSEAVQTKLNQIEMALEPIKELVPGE